MQLATGIRLSAGLTYGEVSIANVSVGPPLFANGSRRGLVLFRLVPAVKSQLESSSILKPTSLATGLSQFLPDMAVLSATMVPFRS